MMRHRTRLYALVASLFLPAAALGAPTELFLSEYIEGSSNNKAVEIYNGTGAAIDLAQAGYNLQIFFNGSASAGQTINLTGSVADGDVYVLANTSSVQAILDNADQTSGSVTYNGDDAVVLRKGTTVIDVIGQVGFDPGSQWGTGLVSTADNTLRRLATVCEGDTDGSDAFDPSVEWEGFAQDTFDGLGAHTASCGPVVPAPDLAISMSATPSAAVEGEQVVVRTTVANAGTVAIANVAVNQPQPADLTYVSFSFQNVSGAGGGCNHPAGGPVACNLSLNPGGTIDLVVTYSVNGGAGTPIVVTAMGTPPAGDTNAANDSASVSIDVVQVVGIHEIQGTGVGSPLAVGTQVVTEGIVTARRSNGYFIQSADAEQDLDPATAEGVFVFTNAAPPAEAVVGNRLRVSARVSEFSRTPHGFPLTQLGNASASVLSSGNALPAPVVLDASVLAPNVSLDALGRYQGMRVQLPEAVVVGPTNGFGDFHVTLPDVPRPAREPGVAALDAVPLPPEKAIPLFDKNPERLRVESTGLEGGTALNVDAGTSLQGMAGVMYYDRGDFTLLMGDNSGIVANGGAFVAAVPAPAPGAVRVASYNIQNLSGGASVDPNRLSKLSEVFCQYLYLPDVVGLVEIANLETAQRLAQAINNDEFGFCPENPQYEAYLLSTNGSQRLGYLVKTAPMAGGSPRVEVLDVVEHFADELLVAPDGSTSASLRLFDRPPLQLDALVHHDDDSSLPLTVLLNHTLSLLDVNNIGSNAAYGTTGNRSREKRRQQAERVSQLVEAIQQADPAQPLVLIGDYNAFEFSDGYVDVMGIIAGNPAPATEVLVPGTSAVTTPLTNLITTKPVAEQYSYVFEGNVQTLDHALVNQAVFEATIPSLHHARVNADFAVDLENDPTVPVRSSDHDPLVAELVVPGFLDADLGVNVLAPLKPVRLDSVATFRVVVRNGGPSAALAPTLDIELDAVPAQLVSLSAPGWQCDAPVADGETSSLRCVREAGLAAFEASVVAITLQPDRISPTDSLGVAATVETRSNDTQEGNNAASASVPVVDRPRWVF